MGHTQKFHRRKKNAECFLKEEHKDIQVETTDCDCTDQDFECDYNFVREGDKCIPSGPIVLPEGACKAGSKPDDTFMGSSGWRLIPGNTCKRRKGPQKDDKVERKCSEATGPEKPPATGRLDSVQHVFSGDWTDLEKHYLERGDFSNGNDETVIVRPRRGSNLGPISISQDHGKTWTHPKGLPSEDIIWIISHQYFKDMVFFITESKTVHYTVDRGRTFHSFKVPHPASIARGRSPLSFHPDNQNWLLWTGEKCEHGECHLEAYFTKDRGDNWHTAARYVEKCEFTGSDVFRYPGRPVEQIICLQKAKESNDGDNPLRLVSSNDWFDHEVVVQDEVKDFATMAEFIVAASVRAEKESLKALTSLDGQTFAEAHFPYNFEVPHQHEYTVLDSSTHAVNLFVATEMDPDRACGSILKSNSNGTSYVLSIAGVNCDSSFYVDFEKMLGLEGVALVNVVANRDSKKKEPKRLQTQITHNDGAEWAYLPPPGKDVDGKPFSCTSPKGDAKCALHIHGYTERIDHRKTYSSKGAVGLMLGWGNVGSSLGPLEEADTYLTTDAGISWKQVKKGRWTWAFGDQGSIIVLVQTTGAKLKTNVISYSTDEGATWTDYKFAEEEVEIVDLTTMRAGGSRNILLFGRSQSGVFTINIDFSGLNDRQCEYLENDPEKSDYYIWSPKHPLQSNNCLFGHVTKYLRKKSDRKCYNGFKTEHLYKEENCACTRQDYECDYNYELDKNGACHLVPGRQPLSAETWCKEHPDAVEYYEPSGYRRIPLTTCSGGEEFDKVTTPHPCPGHEDEFERAHPGPSGFVIFLSVIIPFAVAGAVGWWAWRKWESGGFGQIRLGEHSTGPSGLLDSDRPWVRYPVIAVAAIVAVAGAVPLVLASLWRAVGNAAERWGFGWGSGGARGAWSRLRGGPRRFTTRDSFVRTRGDYAIVDEDEGELLGEESDEDI
ncbi:hypothetical protein VTK73DRAFT_9470 [Phialemonium thermophilum]|uniref:Vacuolar protein sorting/targeting protein 10 n=1 Tax=Phialemonium thermophilum TaxID=223376 RepID=A0ABR3Y468_9PEZI